MSRRFTDYPEAYESARQLATSTRLDVVIRKVKEYGKLGYVS